MKSFSFEFGLFSQHLLFKLNGTFGTFFWWLEYWAWSCLYSNILWFQEIPKRNSKEECVVRKQLGFTSCAWVRGEMALLKAPSWMTFYCKRTSPADRVGGSHQRSAEEHRAAGSGEGEDSSRTDLIMWVIHFPAHQKGWWKSFWKLPPQLAGV